MSMFEHLGQRVFPLKNTEDAEDVEDAHQCLEIVKKAGFSRNVMHV